MDVGGFTPWGPNHQIPRHREDDGSLHDAFSENTGNPVVWLAPLRNRHWHCDPLGPSALDRALVNPAAVFRSPEEVVRHPLLSLGCKREILWRWAWDEYLLELALADGMPEGEPSQLAEVKAALRHLGQEWSPDPSAPASRAVRHEQHDVSLAA